MGFDAADAQSIDESIAAPRVRALGAGELFLNALVPPERDDEFLKDVAHPADAERLPPLDAGDRPRVAGITVPEYATRYKR